MNKQELTQQLTDAQEKTDQRLQQKITQLQQKQQRYEQSYEELTCALHRVLGALEEERLELVGLTHHLNEHNDRWSVSLRVVPKGRKHQFIKHRGYTSSGDGRNQDDLLRKARELDLAIEQHSGIVVYTNYFSFEKKDTNFHNSTVEDRILIDIEL